MEPLFVHYLAHGYGTGYGVAGRRLAHALLGSGARLRWTPIDFNWERDPSFPQGKPAHPSLEPHRRVPGHPHVRILHAPAEVIPPVEAYGDDVPLVCHTVWEADEIQPHWPALLNRCAGVIVPTRWNAEVFRAGGVTVPIAIVPHVRDDLRADVDTAWLESVGDRFVVYGVAAWDARKSPWRAIEAFARAFRDRQDVVYVLKSGRRHESTDPRFQGPGHLNQRTSWALAMVIRELGPSPPVMLLDGFVVDARLRGLHERGDCWLTLPHAEGWDLGAFDAACRGTPVITTGWGGPAEYLDPAAHVLVPARLIPVHVPPHAPHPTRRWVEPDLDAAVEALRAAEADRPAARRRAAAAVADLRDRFAPGRVAADLLRFLEGLVAR